MQTHILGYPRIGAKRELKRACESYWAGKTSHDDLLAVGREIRRGNWLLQQSAGIDLIPCNDFSFYDQVLDMIQTVSAVPDRYLPLAERQGVTDLDLYFAMARGYQQDELDVTAMEMTKWFDTNYHYLVPEFSAGQTFRLSSSKVVDEFLEAKALGINAKPVLIGPISFLLLGKEKEAGFDRIELLDRLLPVYLELLGQLESQGADHIQFDEPCLALDLTVAERSSLNLAYRQIRAAFPGLKLILASYFESYGANLPTVLSLPVDVLHLDLVRSPGELADVLKEGKLTASMVLSLGLVDGRNIWKNDFEQSLKLIELAVDGIGADRVLIAPSCSLLHVPCDLELEGDEEALPLAVKNWLAFATQKIEEVVTLARLGKQPVTESDERLLHLNKVAMEDRRASEFIHRPAVRRRQQSSTEEDSRRDAPYTLRRKAQRAVLKLPLYPTTTIGSFPQTAEVRRQRSLFRRGKLSTQAYDAFVAEQTERTIRLQEDIGLDVLVHGEFERNDMVEYFGEQLEGFAFTKFGWVQSYGSRCVKPPIIYGDVARPAPMTVRWSSYAQSLTDRPVKGMLTGPVTILQWSFVRDDQPRSRTCEQIALAIRDEVGDLQAAGIGIIQIDEPAIREGLPLRKADQQQYLDWAIRAFRLASSGVDDATQIHTHMCYSEFNDIIDDIAAMDADVITIECSRSQMELLDAFAEFAYPNGIGPGIYDIHSPRVPGREEIVSLLKKAAAVIDPELLWVNPDCGLKTRGWEETKRALTVMVDAATTMRQSVPATSLG